MNLFGVLEELLTSSQVTSRTGQQFVQGGSCTPTATISPATAACPCCSGKGAFDVWDKPCDVGHMHQKMLCPTCNGARQFAGAERLVACAQCAGQGALNVWNKPCRKSNMHFAKDCPTCQGKAYVLPPQATAISPMMSGSVPLTAAASTCPNCQGHGAFDTWEKACEVGSMHQKMLCPTCNGQRSVAGASSLTRCAQCEGKGALNVWDKPCFKFHMHFAKDCPTCHGKGFLGSPVAGISGGATIVGSFLQQVLGPLAGQPAELAPQDVTAGKTPEQMQACVRALVNAAKSDGRIDPEEQQRILARLGDVSAAEYQFLLSEFQKPLDVDAFARSVPLGMEPQIYALSLVAIDLDTPAEANYLRQLAQALRLPPQTVAEIHQRLGVRLV